MPYPQLQIREHQWYPRNFLRLSLMAWRQPEAQHDAAEFLEYILPRFTWFPSLFSWSVRLWVGDELQRETHQAVHLLHLNAPDGLISSNLQDAIRAWHQQPQLHALDSAPSKLVLQLPSLTKIVMANTLSMAFPLTSAVPSASLCSVVTKEPNAVGAHTLYRPLSSILGQTCKLGTTGRP